MVRVYRSPGGGGAKLHFTLIFFAQSQPRNSTFHSDKLATHLNQSKTTNLSWSKHVKKQAADICSCLD